MNIQDLFDGKAEQEVLDDAVNFFEGFGKTISQNAGVQAAVKSLEETVTTDVSEAAQWAGTAADPGLGLLAQEAQAAAGPVMAKLLASVGLSAAAGPLGVAETMLMQGVVAVGSAAFKAGLAAAIPQPKTGG